MIPHFRYIRFIRLFPTESRQFTSGITTKNGRLRCNFRGRRRRRQIFWRIFGSFCPRPRSDKRGRQYYSVSMKICSINQYNKSLSRLICVILQSQHHGMSNSVTTCNRQQSKQSHCEHCIVCLGLFKFIFGQGVNWIFVGVKCKNI